MAKTCTCISLKTAGYVIGGLYMTAIFILFLLLISFLSHTMCEADWDYENEKEDVILFFIIFMTIVIEQFFVTGLLLWGILRKRSALLLPWLVSLIVLLIFMMVLIAVHNKSINHWEELIIPVSFTIIGLFFMIIIFSLYRQMKKIKRVQPEPYNQDVDQITRL